MATLTFYVKRPSYLTPKTFKVAMQEALIYLRKITPKDTGYATDCWFVYCTNDQAAFFNIASYISFLERGSSKQAPEGMLKPLKRELPRIYSKYAVFKSATEHKTHAKKALDKLFKVLPGIFRYNLSKER